MSSKRSKNARNSLKKVKHHLVTAGFRDEYKLDCFRKNFRESYLSDVDSRIEDLGVEILKKPFTCAVLPDFINNDVFLIQLLDELKRLELYEKDNDLYKFHQSTDLQNVSSPVVAAFKELLYGGFRCWLQDMTDIALDQTVDMNFSRYEYTDVLLCHDDELEGRRIAFILYLVSPEWCPEDGGKLDLFDTDENGQPDKIVKSLVPRRNNLVFFEVTPTSFHQVSEILSREHVRFSVSGWFHGAPIDRPLPFVEPERERLLSQDLEENEFLSWINPMYLTEDIQIQVQKSFEEDSEIELDSFFQDNLYRETEKELGAKSVQWKMTGPYNKRHFEEAAGTGSCSHVQRLLKVMSSKSMFRLLSKLTGLSLHSLAENGSACSSREAEHRELSTPKMTSIFRRWCQGCYTLIHDNDSSHSETALETTLYFNCNDWLEEYGGSTTYIAKGEDEVLLSIHPKPNSLMLVYRDTETLKFVKHINNGVTERHCDARFFNDMFCEYFE